MNYLETLVAEWYEYSGYFVRTNPRTRKRSTGGYDIEIDVLAFSPSDKRLIHIEVSGDGDSWQVRKHRFQKKKFILSKEEYEQLIGSKIEKVEKIAVVGWGTPKSELWWGDDIKVVCIPQLMKDISSKLKNISIMEQAVPEGFPLLRTVQMVLAFGSKDR